MGQLTQQEMTGRNDGEKSGVCLCVHMYSMQVCVLGVIVHELEVHARGTMTSK